MQVSFGTTSPAAGTGQNAGNKSEYTRTRETRRDTVTLSRKSARIKNLQSQKKRVGQSKQRLIKSTKQKGESLSTIRTKLLLYEQKMKLLNDQIAQAVREEAKAKIEKSLRERDSNKKLRPDEEYARLAKEAGLTTSLTLNRTVQNGRARADAEATGLADEIRRASPRARADNKEAREVEKKQAELRRLQEKA